MGTHSYSSSYRHPPGRAVISIKKFYIIDNYDKSIIEFNAEIKEKRIIVS
jgi:hypothetical protein